MLGEDACGDHFVIHPFPGGVLAAVLDGLGHGPGAREAALAAEAPLGAHAGDLAATLRACHDALRPTRGAAIHLLAFHTAAAGPHVVKLGVGNVVGVRVREGTGWEPERRTLLSVGGTVGYALPRLAPRRIDLQPGDLFVLATDGLDSAMPHEVPVRGSPSAIAHRLLRDHGSDGDDSLVLVVRYTGAGTSAQ